MVFFSFLFFRSFGTSSSGYEQPAHTYCCWRRKNILRRWGEINWGLLQMWGWLFCFNIVLCINANAEPFAHLQMVMLRCIYRFIFGIICDLALDLWRMLMMMTNTYILHSSCVTFQPSGTFFTHLFLNSPMYTCMKNRRREWIRMNVLHKIKLKTLNLQVLSRWLHTTKSTAHRICSYVLRLLPYSWRVANKEEWVRK